MEKDLRLTRAEAAHAAGGRAHLDDEQVWEMQQFVDQLLDRMQMTSGGRDPEFASPQAFAAVQQKAIELAQRNPHFRDLWNRWWRRDWGLIDEPMRLGD
jgi:hypothetical protein